MKAVILAGGLGTRIAEETHVTPKPMIHIGGKPIIWHIMKLFSYHGINDFIICCGHKGYVIKEYFANYFLHTSDVTFDLRNNSFEVHRKTAEPWKITLIDTGELTQTGGRLLRIAPHLKREKDFCFTYGDGVSDVDISALIRHHRANNTKATLTAVAPPGRFGALETEGDRIVQFTEKPSGDGSLINGGFFVLSTDVLNYLTNDSTIWEHAPLRQLAEEGQLTAYKHKGFWQPMDTLRDKNLLESLWESGNAPWKVW